MKFKQIHFVTLCLTVFVGLALGYAYTELNPTGITIETIITLTTREQNLPHDFAYHDFYEDQATLANHALALKSDTMIAGLVANPIIQQILAFEKQFLPDTQVSVDPKTRFSTTIQALPGPGANQITLTVTDHNVTLAHELSELLPQLYDDNLKKQMASRLAIRKIKGQILSGIHEDESEVAANSLVTAKESNPASLPREPLADLVPLNPADETALVLDQHQISSTPQRLKVTLLTSPPSFVGLCGFVGLVVGVLILLVADQVAKTRLYRKSLKQLYKLNNPKLLW